MSWDTRRLAMAIESAAIIIAATWVFLRGYWAVAAIAVGLVLVNDIFFMWDWVKHGESQLKGE